jgi:hypothetical protein
MAVYLQSNFIMSSCRDFVDAGVAALRRIRQDRRLDDESSSVVVEREILRRGFWTLWTLDVYLTTVLGLPRLLDEDLSVNDVTMSADDEFLALVTGPNTFAEREILMPAAEAHTELTIIQEKILKRIYLVDEHSFVSESTFRVDYEEIFDMEKDLDDWHSKVSRKRCLGRTAEETRSV